MERSDVIEDGNFLHSVGDIYLELFDEVVHIDIVLRKYVEDWKSGNFT